jgi:hypothetical protein
VADDLDSDEDGEAEAELGPVERRPVAADDPDLAAYERLLLDTLMRLPGVSDIRSNFAIQTVKAGGGAPRPGTPPPRSRRGGRP